VASLTTDISPFSRFSNYNRYLLILEGGPVLVTNKTRNCSEQLCSLSNILVFDGDDELQSKAEKAGRDFNLFVRKDQQGYV
jgi:environmental stress-induced protein Ves